MQTTLSHRMVALGQHAPWLLMYCFNDELVVEGVREKETDVADGGSDGRSALTTSAESRTPDRTAYGLLSKERTAYFGGLRVPP